MHGPQFIGAIFGHLIERPAMGVHPLPKCSICCCLSVFVFLSRFREFSPINLQLFWSHRLSSSGQQLGKQFAMAKNGKQLKNFAFPI